MNKSEVMTVKEYKTRVTKASVLIDKVHLQNDPLYDLRSSDMQYIHNKNKDKDLTDLMYDCYKLGFARGLQKAESEQTE
jgi:hypothetical protein